MVIKGLFLIFLLFHGLVDQKTKKVYMPAVGLQVCLGFILDLLWGRAVTEIFYAILPGLLIFLVAYVSEERIGYGDGYICLAAALYMSASDLLFWLFLAFLLAGLFALLSYGTRLLEETLEIPFVPFLCLADLLLLLFGRGGL